MDTFAPRVIDHMALKTIATRMVVSFFLRINGSKANNKRFPNQVFVKLSHPVTYSSAIPLK